MKKNLLVLPLLFIACSAFFIPHLAFAQEQKTEPTATITIEGRIVSKLGMVMLITTQEKGYLIMKAEGLDEVFNKVKEYAGKDFDLVLSGKETGETKGYGFVDYQKKQSWIEEYRVFKVSNINEVKKGSKVTKIDIGKLKPVAQPLPPALVEHLASPTLKKIGGKISKCNFKSVIPSIELEGKPDFTITIPPDVEAIKVVGGNLMAFKPKDVLKKGIKVEIWYEEKGYLRNARIINVQERDIAEKKKE